MAIHTNNSAQNGAELILNNKLLFELAELEHAWADGLYFLPNSDGHYALLFGSFWCSNAAAHLLLGNMSKSSNTGFDRISLENFSYHGKQVIRALANEKDRIAFSNLIREYEYSYFNFPVRMNEDFCSISSRHKTEVGDLIHLRVYHRAFQFATPETIYLANPDLQRLWQAFKFLSPYPLLDEWQKDILRAAFKWSWVKRLTSLNLKRGYVIQLTEARREALKNYLEEFIPTFHSFFDVL